MAFDGMAVGAARSARFWLSVAGYASGSISQIAELRRQVLGLDELDIEVRRCVPRDGDGLRTVEVINPRP